MSEPQTRSVAVKVAAHTYRLEVLDDRVQYSTPRGEPARFGLSAAQWGNFGHVWPTMQLLAQAAARVALGRRRVLELHCGIGLASLVLQRRGADVVASDAHPLAPLFLARNAALNAIRPPDFRRLRWDAPSDTLGRFDLIFAADVLYEAEHVAQLADLIARHANGRAEIVFTDPGLQNSERFSRQLALQGFVASVEACPMNDQDLPPYRGRLLVHRRDMDAAVA